MERDRYLTGAMGRKTGYYPTYVDENGSQWNTLRLMETEEEAIAYYEGRYEEHGAKPSWCGFKSWLAFGQLVESREIRDAAGSYFYRLLGEVFSEDYDNVPDRFANALYEFLKSRER